MAGRSLVRYGRHLSDPAATAVAGPPPQHGLGRGHANALVAHTLAEDRG